MEATKTERYETIVIGAGQAGLATGYHLKQAGRPFLILDANERVGDVWRKRWDSLRLFTPAGHDSLPGLRFPAKSWSFPTKDQVGDYLESYAERFALPVRTGVRVTRLTKRAERFVIETDGATFEADTVVVATGFAARPHLPDFALDLDPRILQLHSSEYRDPSMLRPGGVLVVGAGNSGAEISVEVARTHRTLLSGRYERMKIGPSRSPIVTAVAWQILSHVMTIRTPIGRKMRSKMNRHGTAPVERVSRKDLDDAGVTLVGRTEGVRDGRPVLADGQIVDVANVIWCTGFRSGLREWIDLPIFDEAGEPRHARGTVDGADGLYLVGRIFQYAFTSMLIGGVGRDAEYVARQIATRAPIGEPEGVARPARA